MQNEPKTVNIQLSPLKASKLNVILAEYLKCLELTIAAKEVPVINSNEDLEMDVIADYQIQLSAAISKGVFNDTDVQQELCDYNKAFRLALDNEAKNN